MRPASAFMACTHRHFSETGFALALSVIAFQIGLHLSYLISTRLSTNNILKSANFLVKTC